MGKKLSIGVSATSHKGKKGMIGVSNAAHKIKKMWIGDANSKPRLFFSSGGNNPLIFIYNNTNNATEQHTFVASGDDMRTATFTKNALAEWTLSTSKGAPYIIGERYFYVGANSGSNYGTYQYSDDGKTWTKNTVSLLPSGATSIQSYFEKATYMGDGKFAFGSTSTSSSNSIPHIGILDVNSGEVTLTKVLETNGTQRISTIVKYDNQTHYIFANTASGSSITMNVYKWNGATTVTKLSAQLTGMYTVADNIYSMIPMGDCILFTTYQSGKYVYAFNMKTGTLTQLVDVGNKDTFLVKISDTEFMAVYSYTDRQFRRYTFSGSTATLVSNYTKTENGYQRSTPNNYVCRDKVLYFVSVDNPGNYYARFYLEYSTDYGKTWTKQVLYDSTKYGVSTYTNSKSGIIWNGLESEVNDSTYGLI